MSKEQVNFGEDEEIDPQQSHLGASIASPVTKGHTNKQRYSPTARRLGTSEPFVDPKKRKKAKSESGKSSVAKSPKSRSKSGTKSLSKSKSQSKPNQRKSGR